MAVAAAAVEYQPLEPQRMVAVMVLQVLFLPTGQTEEAAAAAEGLRPEGTGPTVATAL